MKTRGGKRAGAGRHPLEGGRWDVNFRIKKSDHEAMVKAAGSQPLTVWLRDAAERALTVDPPRVPLPHNAEKVTAYSTIPGNLMKRLKVRAHELGFKRMAHFLRCAAVDRLQAVGWCPAGCGHQQQHHLAFDAGVQDGRAGNDRAHLWAPELQEIYRTGWSVYGGGKNE